VPTTLPPGPYMTLSIDAQGESVPWYVIPFDKNGICTAPLTRDHLLRAITETSRFQPERHTYLQAVACRCILAEYGSGHALGARSQICSSRGRRG
jgi:hypothetical protein